MSRDLQSFRKRAALAIENAAHDCAANDTQRWAQMADAVIEEFAKPTDTMIDAAYEAVRFDEAWAINSRRAFIKALKAMVRSALRKNKPA